MKKWLHQHQQAFQLVVSRLHTQRLNTLMIIAVIGITVTLPSLIYVAVNNLQDVVQQVKQDAQMTVFLNTDIDQIDTQHIKEDLLKLDTVQNVSFVSKDEALAQMAKQYPDQHLTENLDGNPLPDAFYLALSNQSPQNADTLKSQISQLKGVRDVLIDSAWLKKLNHLIDLGRNVANLLGLLLSIAMIAVVSNTVRMQMLTHQAEIEVSRLIGATQSFIRRPFLYLGFMYGIGGGIMAMLILGLVLIPLNLSMQALAQDYQTNFSLTFDPLHMSVIVIGITALIGWLAAFVAISQQR